MMQGKHTLLSLILLLSPLVSQAQQPVLSANFNSGIPATWQNLDRDALPVGDGFSINVSGNWFSGYANGTSSKVALSTSHHATQGRPADNWLISPQMLIEEGMYLTWEARSLHYDEREQYEVLVSTTDNAPESFQLLFAVDGEDYTFTKHILSMEAYVGKQIYLAFRHTSTDGFLLALENVRVGVPAETILVTDDQTRKFCGNTGTHRVVGEVRNYGVPLALSAIVLRDKNGEEMRMPWTADGPLATAGVCPYAFDLPVRVGEASRYTLFAETQDGSRTPLLRDSVVCSYYPRTLLLEKGSGVWCTACPSVIPFVHQMKARYGEELVCVEYHSAYNDQVHLSDTIYDQGMGSTNYPVIYYNRHKEQPQYSSNSLLPNVIHQPTYALTALQVAQWGNDSIAVEAQVTFAKDLDNAQDHLRFGFAVKERDVTLPYSIQKSNATLLAHEEYAMMQNPIPAQWMHYHDLVRSAETAFNGVAESLPAVLHTGETYTYRGILPIPVKAANRQLLSVVAYALDTETDEVLNVSEARLNYTPTGIHSATQPSCHIRIASQSRNVRVELPATTPYYIYVYRLNGQLVHTHTGEGTMQTEVALPQAGPYLVKVRQGNSQASSIIQ